MTTPFDNNTWQLRYTSTAERVGLDPLYPVSATLVANSQTQDTIASRVADTGLVSAPLNSLTAANQNTNVNYLTNENLPLIDNAHFKIGIPVDPSPEYPVTIKFVENVPESIELTWKNARNIYYEPEFHTIRGNLYSNSLPKEDALFINHFMITYKGRSGIDGLTKRLRVDLFNYSSISIPTADLLLETYQSWVCDRGAWIAD